MATRNESKRARMQALLAEQEASGLSIAEFARQRDLPRWVLYEWRRRLRRAVAPESRRGESAFAEVRVVEEARAAAPLTVELTTGHRVQVPAGFDARDVRRLLEVLGSC